uniref:hypothetical protein n=1 Tax=Vulcanococcus limneticus TaxID=2170428 RepID=UPI00398C1FE1
MRIRAANALITAFYLTLAVASGMAFRRFDRERRGETVAYSRQLRATDQVARFLAGSKQLTSSVQGYAATGDPAFAQAYWREVEVTRSRDRAAEDLAALGLTPAEEALIRQAKANSDALIAVESRAIDAARGGDQPRALGLVFGPAYQRALRGIYSPSYQLQQQLQRRLQAVLEQNRRRAASWWRLCLALALLNLLLVVVYPR